MNEKNVYQRINDVMNELSYIKKTGSVSYGNNTYTAVLHDDVTRAVQPLFVKHGLVSVPSMTDTKIKMYDVTTKKGQANRYECQTTVELKVVNIDNPNEEIIVTSVAHSFDSQDKSTGKAYSMAVKYCYLKLLMLESGDEEESRVEEAKVTRNEKISLVNELIATLKELNQFKEEYLETINALTVEQLKGKLAEKKEKLKCQ